jgi:hypothetical protein
MKSVKSVAKLWFNTALYWVGAALGNLALIVEANCTLTLRPFSMSRLGRWLFITLGRTGLNFKNAVLVMLVVGQYWLLPMGQQLDINVILLSPFVMFLSIHRRRVFSVTNNGSGRWSLHLNVLKSSHQEENSKWVGVNAELTEVVTMAIAAGARELKCESFLLVQQSTVQAFTRKLTRAFRQHGVQVRVEVQECRSMGTFLTGVHHPLKRFHHGLKEGRVTHPTSTSLTTRRIVVHIPANNHFSACTKAEA